MVNQEPALTGIDASILNTSKCLLRATQEYDLAKVRVLMKHLDELLDARLALQGK